MPSCERSAPRTRPAASSSTTSRRSCCTRSAPASHRPTSTATPGSARPSWSSRTFRSAPPPTGQRHAVPARHRQERRPADQGQRRPRHQRRRRLSVGRRPRASPSSPTARDRAADPREPPVYDADDLGCRPWRPVRRRPRTTATSFTWPSISPDGSLIAAHRPAATSVRLHRLRSRRHEASPGDRPHLAGARRMDAHGPRLAFGGGRTPAASELAL